MKKLVFTLLIIGIGISLSAQIEPRPKPMKPSKENKGTSIGKPTLSDHALTPCERDMRYLKTFLLHIIRKEENLTLDLASLMRRVRVVFRPGLVGKLVFVKTSGSVPFPELPSHSIIPNQGVYNMDTEGFSIIDQENSQVSTIALRYEAGDYSNIKSVIDIYRIGNNNYADLRGPNGSVRTIRIFPEFALDNDCMIPMR